MYIEAQPKKIIDYLDSSDFLLKVLEGCKLDINYDMSTIASTQIEASKLIQKLNLERFNITPIL